MYMVPHTTLHLCNCIGRIDKLFANITNDFNQSAVSALYIRAGLPLSVGRTNNRTSWQYNWPTCTLISRTFSAWQRLVNKRTEQRNHETALLTLLTHRQNTQTPSKSTENAQTGQSDGDRVAKGRRIAAVQFGKHLLCLPFHLIGISEIISGDASAGELFDFNCMAGVACNSMRFN